MVTPASLARFESKVDRSGGPDACHLWTAGLGPSGYGAVRINYVLRAAHRVAWELEHGPIPAGMHVCHSCDVRYPKGDITNRRCVNPRHLWLGTNADNHADKIAKGRAVNVTGDRHGSRTRPERRPRGEVHSATMRRVAARGERSSSAKLTAAKVAEIRLRLLSGETAVSVAGAFSVGATAVRDIRSGKTWSHVCAVENCETGPLDGPRDRGGFCSECADEVEAMERESAGGIR